KLRYLLVFIALLGTAVSAFAASADKHWLLLEPFAEGMYREKVAEAHALAAESGKELAGFDAVAIEDVSKMAVYHQLYFVLDCTKLSDGSMESVQACTEVRSEEFAN